VFTQSEEGGKFGASVVLRAVVEDNEGAKEEFVIKMRLLIEDRARQFCDNEWECVVVCCRATTASKGLLRR
jgi:hypothetical protein